jgi:hypothetical protein
MKQIYGKKETLDNSLKNLERNSNNVSCRRESFMNFMQRGNWFKGSKPATEYFTKLTLISGKAKEPILRVINSIDFPIKKFGGTK